MGCGASTETTGAGRSNEGKYPNKFFKSHYAAVNAELIDKSVSAAPVFEIERVSTVYLLRQPTSVKLVRREDGSPFEPASPRESWSLFNDSKSPAKLSVTFFHARHIAVLCGEDPTGALEATGEAPFVKHHGDVTVTRTGEGDDQRLAVVVTLAPGETAAFVDGVSSGGYMWKCLVPSRDGDLMASPVEAE